MTKELFIQKVAEYISTLPDKTDMTMQEVVDAACRNEDISDIEFLDFSLLDEIIKLSDKMGMVLDYRSHEGSSGGAPFNLDFIVIKKRLQKAQIISDLQGWGPIPERSDPVEQRLTISSTGMMWFNEYLFSDGRRYRIGRRERFSIGKEAANEVLSLIADYVESNTLGIIATDIGNWNLNATYSDGHIVNRTGSMCGGVTINNIDLTKFIRESVPIVDLRVFDKELGSCSNEAVYEFASKWYRVFNDPDFNPYFVFDNLEFSKNCRELDFEMDCGRAFSKTFPEKDVFNNWKDLRSVIYEVDDIALLGSAIHSKWRYFNHWAYSISESADIENRTWFIIILARLMMLSEDGDATDTERLSFSEIDAMVENGDCLTAEMKRLFEEQPEMKEAYKYKLWDSRK